MRAPSTVQRLHCYESVATPVISQHYPLPPLRGEGHNHRVRSLLLPSAPERRPTAALWSRISTAVLRPLSGRTYLRPLSGRSPIALLYDRSPAAPVYGRSPATPLLGHVALDRSCGPLRPLCSICNSPPLSNPSPPVPHVSQTQKHYVGAAE